MMLTSTKMVGFFARFYVCLSSLLCSMFVLLGSSCCVWLLYPRGRLSVRSSYKTSSINRKVQK
jgi:hypothetical protein